MRFIFIIMLCLSFQSSQCFSDTDGFYEKPEWKVGEMKVYEHWVTSVSTRQHTLGSCIIKAKRPMVERISGLTQEELLELPIVMKELEQALEKNPNFNPDRFNYLQLGNGLHQLHFHVIPRYQTSREFAGLAWEDAQFGHPPVFTDFKPSEEVIIEIREELLKQYQINSNEDLKLTPVSDYL